jgi:hypothetical protein
MGTGVMDFRIADTFTDSLAWLPAMSRRWSRRRVSDGMFTRVIDRTRTSGGEIFGDQKTSVPLSVVRCMRRRWGSA